MSYWDLSQASGGWDSRQAIQEELKESQAPRVSGSCKEDPLKMDPFGHPSGS